MHLLWPWTVSGTFAGLSTLDHSAISHNSLEASYFNSVSTKLEDSTIWGCSSAETGHHQQLSIDKFQHVQKVL